MPPPGLTSGRAHATGPTLTVSLRTLLCTSSEPGRLGRIGPVTASVTRTLAAAAARDPGCPWEVIVTDDQGLVIAVTRARLAAGHGSRGLGSQPVTTRSVLSRVTVVATATDLTARPEPVHTATPGPAGSTPPGTGDLDRDLAARLTAVTRVGRRAVELTRQAGATGQTAGTPADGVPPGCSHRGTAPGYRIPQRLRRFVEARDQTCTNPICRQPAHRCDIDHTIPWDAGGPTCRCNTGPACRHHHRMKQLKRWHLSQPRPGTFVWKTPAGLTYTTTPEPYRI